MSASEHLQGINADANGRHQKGRYEQLRARLTGLWASPVPHMPAIEATLRELGDAQAAFEAAQGGTGPHTGIKLHSTPDAPPMAKRNDSDEEA